MNKLSLSLLVCAAVLFAASPAFAGGNAAAGKEKADSCADCHGDDGKGDSDVPGIAGMSVADFTKAMGEYKSGAKKNHQMEKVAKKLSDEDVADLAAYFATLKK